MWRRKIYRRTREIMRKKEEEEKEEDEGKD